MVNGFDYLVMMLADSLVCYLTKSAKIQVFVVNQCYGSGRQTKW